MKTRMSHIQQTMQAQESRASVHKRVTHTVAALDLPFKASHSRARVNHAKNLGLVQPQAFSNYVFLQYYCINISAYNIICGTAAKLKPHSGFFSIGPSLIIISKLLVSRSMDLWKITNIASLYSCNKLSFPPFFIFINKHSNSCQIHFCN